MGSGTKVALVVVLILGVVAAASILQHDIERAPSGAEQAQVPPVSLESVRFSVPVELDPMGAGGPIKGTPRNRRGESAGLGLETPIPRELAKRPESRYEGLVPSRSLSGAMKPVDAVAPGLLYPEKANAVPAVYDDDLANGESNLPGSAPPFYPAGQDGAGDRAGSAVRRDPSSEAEPRTHKVMEGDTLWGLAEHYYGQGWRYKNIAEVNSLTNEDELRVGMKLTIPPLAAASRATVSASKPALTSSGAKAYTIREGDTLYDIASQLLGTGSRWEEIMTMNPGLEANRLRVGKSLQIPKN